MSNRLAYRIKDGESIEIAQCGGKHNEKIIFEHYDELYYNYPKFNMLIYLFH